MIWVDTHILKFLTLGTPDSPGQETIYNILPSVIVGDAGNNSNKN